MSEAGSQLQSPALNLYSPMPLSQHGNFCMAFVCFEVGGERGSQFRFEERMYCFEP